jgi:hypothetical protein
MAFKPTGDCLGDLIEVPKFGLRQPLLLGLSGEFKPVVSPHSSIFSPLLAVSVSLGRMLGCRVGDKPKYDIKRSFLWVLSHL